MQLQWKTNRKSYVSYRMAPISMSLSDLECHCSCLKPFWLPFLNEYCSCFLHCVYTWMAKYLRSSITTFFWKWNTFRGYSSLQAVTYTVKVVVSKKWCKIGTLFLHTTNRKYHMAYRFVPFPMTLDDLEGSFTSPVARLIKCNLTNVCAPFYTVSTDTACCAVPRR